MPMVFCRGCAQHIHSEASTCPGCGAPQTTAAVKTEGYPTLAVISCVISAFNLLIIITDDLSDRDTVIGLITLAIISGIFGIASLQQRSPGHAMAVTGVVTSVLFLLVGIGSLI